LKLLDMFHGLLAFHLEGHWGASEMDHRAKLSSVLPKRSTGAISKLVHLVSTRCSHVRSKPVDQRTEAAARDSKTVDGGAKADC
jgi:hypothetical protein